MLVFNDWLKKSDFSRVNSILAPANVPSVFGNLTLQQNNYSKAKISEHFKSSCSQLFTSFITNETRLKSQNKIFRIYCVAVDHFHEPSKIKLRWHKRRKTLNLRSQHFDNHECYLSHLLEVDFFPKSEKARIIILSLNNLNCAYRIGKCSSFADFTVWFYRVFKIQNNKVWITCFR